MTSTTTFHLVRQASAAKLSATAAGSIHYAILIDAERTEPHLALTGNDGGGYFSREAVPIAALRRCAERAGTDTALGASAFKAAFIGRSTNNGYFAVAALCAEGLLNRVQREGPGRGQPLADAGFWDDWTAQVVAQAAAQGDELPVFHIGKPPTESVDPTTESASDATPTGDDQATAADVDTDVTADVQDVADQRTVADEGMVTDSTDQTPAKIRRKAKARS